MATVVKELMVETGGVYDVVDLTQLINDVVKASGVKKGVAVVYSVDPLCPIFTIEYESRLLSDIVKYVKGLSESEEKARLLAATVLGSGIVIPVVDGHIVTASFQQVALMELNEKGGKRKVCVVIQGE